MGIFGEQCVRCGARRTRRELDGVPTCEDCERRLRAAHETPRLCPTDRAEMVKEVVAGVVIDRCPVCRGVWLDAGELQLVRDAARGEGVAQAITNALAPLY
jgi:hypothetical protein